MLRNLFVYILICGLFFIPVSSQATQNKIVETSYLADVLTEVQGNALVLFDIDDTLINTICMLGNTSWWNYFTTHVLQSNVSFYKSRTEIHAVIQKILQRIPVNLIESNASDIIAKLQKHGVMVLALTARCINPDYLQAADQSTHYHLKSVGIDFTQTTISKAIDTQTSRFFSYGIIFTDHQEKGPFLKAFLNNLDLHPSKIIFIDDNLKQIKSVEDVVKSMNIPFAGFRYNKLDNVHQQFDPLVVNIQLEALIKDDRVLSDEEAKKIAHENPYLAPHYFIDQLIQTWCYK